MSVMIPAGSTTASRQALIDANPTITSFCLEAGSHAANGSNAPKSGDIFTGQFGATIDGTGWATGDATQAPFRAHNENIDDVTIRNIAIRHMPQYGIRSYKDFSSGWIVENCEIDDCERGIEVCDDSITRYCYIHHIRDAGYTGNTPNNVLFESNRFAFILGAGNQKLVEGNGHTFLNNIFEDLSDNGIWEDGNNVNVVIKGNRLIRVAGVGIFYEISGGTCVIEDNVIDNCGQHGIALSTSRDAIIRRNTITDCSRGIWAQVNLDVVGQPGGAPISGWDLIDNLFTDNTVRLTAAYVAGAPTPPYVAGIDYSGSGDGTPYIDGTKNNDFETNAYTVPDTGSYWFNAGSKSWAQWQALPQDAAGSRTIVP